MSSVYGELVFGAHLGVGCYVRQRTQREFGVCVGSCFRKLEDRRTVINLGFINYNIVILGPLSHLPHKTWAKWGTGLVADNPTRGM